MAIDVVVRQESSFLASLGIEDPRAQLVVLAILTFIVWALVGPEPPMAYALIMLGVAGSLLRLTGGYTAMVLGTACAAAMYWVIDPKLRAISAEYEEQQAQELTEASGDEG